jgi:hypothetical protein
MKKKIAILGSVLVVVAISMVFVQSHDSNPQDDLLIANIEALTGDEYHQGTYGNNWETYTIDCVAYGPSSNSGSWSWNQSLSAYVLGASQEIGGGYSNSTSFEPHRYRKDVCGYGLGFCLESAPGGHPCMG